MSKRGEGVRKIVTRRVERIVRFLLSEALAKEGRLEEAVITARMTAEHVPLPGLHLLPGRWVAGGPVEEAARHRVGQIKRPTITY